MPISLFSTITRYVLYGGYPSWPLLHIHPLQRPPRGMRIIIKCTSIAILLNVQQVHHTVERLIIIIKLPILPLLEAPPPHILQCNNINPFRNDKRKTT